MSERPSSPAIEALVEDLLKSAGQLIRRMRSEANPAGLSWSQSVALARLDKGGATTTADLARAEGVKPQSMGATMAALERDGLVERRPHPTDGRQFLFDLTALGVATRARHRALKREWLSAAMAGLNEADQQALATALRLIERLAQS